jgi:XTP/dITP diphosphohydrolase
VTKVVVATHNAHKVEEILGILKLPGWELCSLREAGVSKAAVEDGVTFEQNALIKARFARQRTGLAALADDSGLVVDALAGAPGVLSSRYAGETASDAENRTKLLAAMANVAAADRSARFVCAVAYIDDAGTEHVCRGTLEGRIAEAESGEGGFGYDSVFIPAAELERSAIPAPAPAGQAMRTLAEYSSEEKNAVSHRFAALNALVLKLAGTDGALAGNPPFEGTAPVDAGCQASTLGAAADAKSAGSAEVDVAEACSDGPAAARAAGQGMAAQGEPAQAEPVRIAVFDFDGTLIDAASPVRLILRLIARRIMPVRVAARISLWGMRYKMGTELDQSIPRRYIFSSLKQHSAATADAMMRSLYQDELKRFLRPQALKRIDEHKRNGLKFLIVSASFEPIVQEAARDLGADGYIATKMEAINGRYTGKTAEEPPEGEQKLKQFVKYADARYGQGNWTLEWAYGDHFSDVPLMQMAARAVAVDPDRRLERIAKSLQWPVESWLLEQSTDAGAAR